MAQTATMGPPTSPRETRRSGRRSAPSASTSTSKSPDSDQPPRQRDNPQRISSGSNNNRTKRLKQEELDEGVDDRRHTSVPSNSSANSTGTTTNKGRRKAKDKDKRTDATDSVAEAPPDSSEDQAQEAPEEEEQGITRCVCGSTGEDDPDAGEFMVQCETCKVWQHGLCMGYQSEDQVHDDDYYCELCRPEMHTELLKKLAKRPRHSSTTSHHTSAPATSRLSRSHSPSHLLKQPSKRRNTMNSRDAAFDESLKEIIEATAAEAAAVHDTSNSIASDHLPAKDEDEEHQDQQTTGKRKRKRTDDDTTGVPKRTRSASSASDHPSSIIANADVPATAIQTNKAPNQPTAPKSSGRNKRGRKNVNADVSAPLEGEDGVTSTSTRRQGNNGRAKNANTTKRPPISHTTSHGQGNGGSEQGSRRNQSSNVNGQHTSATTLESTRVYRNSHAYAVSQQPLFTSWNLPDYLSHLEEMLPTDTPQPLEVRGGTTGLLRGESAERTMERGVKVKWPSKRMSVGDMNKRVRALVEWVGREQASALDRERRREAIEKALKEETYRTSENFSVPGSSVRLDGKNSVIDAVAPMDTDEVNPKISETEDMSKVDHDAQIRSDTLRYGENTKTSATPSSTMKMMEELMEELIGFQERFGPGARSRDRERRLAATA